MTSARSTFRTRRPRSRWPCPTQSGWRRNGAIGVALSASGHADQRANPMLTRERLSAAKPGGAWRRRLLRCSNNDHDVVCHDRPLSCSRVQRMDIVVFGATGFVGRLVARYLAEHAPAGVTIGLAGRSPEKLQRTAAELGVDWPLVVADTSDETSLAAMASGARVVATTVGPYWPAGLKLVDACIAAGTQYLDLTGEILFVRKSIFRHDRAGAAGARIVHSCGFDSVPSDLGVLMLHEAGGEMGDMTLVVKALKGGFSGGTLASAKGQIDEVRRNGAARKTMLDPNALAPGREPVGERDCGGSHATRGTAGSGRS